MLDTHVAIWTISDRTQIPRRILDLIADPDHDVFVSAASIWEIAIKHGLKRANAPPLNSEDSIKAFLYADFTLLDITTKHAAAVESISTPHADPFDRLLIAQAITEPLALITRDSKIATYSPTFITW
ncbi:type II toxin-antitoxin system VapC family toxin [Rhizobium sp. RU20A]|uniref:type II toxin-antitoxin system VapC family toxin n=1 Tax=Rhizobium sp. RU20A TaxID=1907412 RepID=UPI001AEDD695|nr:type II toxin-antitoxin system VapC family toxin [Rhizobium sp. RU20A]